MLFNSSNIFRRQRAQPQRGETVAVPPSDGCSLNNYAREPIEPANRGRPTTNYFSNRSLPVEARQPTQVNGNAGPTIDVVPPLDDFTRRMTHTNVHERQEIDDVNARTPREPPQIADRSRRNPTVTNFPSNLSLPIEPIQFDGNSSYSSFIVDSFP